MKFRTKLFLGVLALVLVGAVAAFLFLPKNSKGSGVSFITDSGVDATVSGGVTGNASVLELSELTYSGGETPTGGDLSSWEANLEFGEGYEVILTISVSNNAGSILYVALVDNGTNVNNLTKTIKNGTETYTSGTLVMVQGRSNTTFTITFRREHDVATKITYRYEIKLQSTLLEEDLQNVETPDETGFTYKYDEAKGEASVTGLTTSNTQTTLTIPSMVVTEGKMYIVTAIEANAFKGKNITSVVVPNTVKELKASVFENCSNLTQVTIPDSVTKLGNKVFKGCTSLVSIQLPNTLTSVGTYLFSGCTKLENYNIPTGIKKLSNYMFENCTKLTTFNIPSHITTLGNYVFYGCNLETLNIPDTITSLTQNTFAGITNITELIIPCSVTALDGANNGLFENVENIENATIEVTNKGNEIGRAFFYCRRLTSITIPSGVTSLGNDAFFSCGGLTSVTLAENSQLITIGGNAFSSCVDLTKVVVSSIEDWLKISFRNGVANPLYYAQHLFIGEEEVTELIIPNTITEIKTNAFYGCSGLNSITIPSSVTNIGGSAFSQCVGLAEVNLIGNSNFMNIDSSAFADCSGLTKVKTQSIENWLNISFENGYSNPLYYANHLYINETEISKLILQNSVTQIKPYAFCGCLSFISITIPESLDSIGNFAFTGCYSLGEIYNESNLDIALGSTDNGYVAYYAVVIYSGEDAHAKDNNDIIIDGVIYHKVTEDEYYVVGLADKTLSNINIDPRASKIKSYAFYNIQSLTSVTIPNGVTDIGQCAFSLCYNLANVTLPEGLTTIKFGTFDACYSLTSITIPSSVATIEDSAFYGCYGLAEVYNLSSINMSKGSTGNGYVAYYCEVINKSLSVESRIVTIDGIKYYKYSDTVLCAICLVDKTKTSLTFDSRTKSLRQYAFQHCQYLETVTIPSFITSLGQYAFEACEGIGELHISSRTAILTFNRLAFYKIKTIDRITVDSIEDWLKISFDGGTNFTPVPSNPLRYTNKLIINGNYSTTITIPNTITTIPAYAFSGYKNLKSIIMEDGGVISIGAHAFYYCKNLENVTLSNNIMSIGVGAFYICDSLTNVYISSLNVLLSATYSSADLDLGGRYSSPLNKAKHLYVGDEEVSNLVVPSDVQTISAWCFYSFDGLTSVTISEGVTSIGVRAFSVCSNIKELKISSTVSSIGNYAFTSCHELTTVTIDSADIYKAAVGTTDSQVGGLLTNATTINVLASVVDDESNTNTFLNDATIYTKSATTTTIDGKEYYVYTKIV